MKRAELIVGEELYYTTERGWATPAYAGAPRGERVRVLAKEPWKDVRDHRPLDARLKPCDTGSYVLVERTDRHGNTYRDVLPLAGLKGGYAAIHAEVVKWIVQRDNADAVAEDARLERRSRAAYAMASIGVTGELTYNGRRVTVDSATFRAMAAVLAELEWRYDK